jgi:phosphoribosylaminoimidazole-succinocarboxamide synthase
MSRIYATGKAPKRQIILVDEIYPDTCQFWDILTKENWTKIGSEEI